MSLSSVDVEENILKAAREEFARHGFHSAVVSDIADQAGVGKGTVYRHFGRKSQLFGELIRRGTHELLDRIRSATRSESSSPVEQLTRVMHVHFDYFEESGELLEIIVNEGLHRTGERRSELIDTWETYTDVVAEVFREGIRGGIFRDHDPQKLAWLYLGCIWSVLRSAVIFNHDQPRSRPREQYASILIDLFLKGIRAS